MFHAEKPRPARQFWPVATHRRLHAPQPLLLGNTQQPLTDKLRYAELMPANTASTQKPRLAHTFPQRKDASGCYQVAVVDCCKRHVFVHQRWHEVAELRCGTVTVVVQISLKQRLAVRYLKRHKPH